MHTCATSRQRTSKTPDASRRARLEPVRSEERRGVTRIGEPEHRAIAELLILLCAAVAGCGNESNDACETVPISPAARARQPAFYLRWHRGCAGEHASVAEPGQRLTRLPVRAMRPTLCAAFFAVAPPGLEPGSPFGRGILNPLRLPFRQGARICSAAYQVFGRAARRALRCAFICVAGSERRAGTLGIVSTPQRGPGTPGYRLSLTRARDRKKCRSDAVLCSAVPALCSVVSACLGVLHSYVWIA